MLTFRAIELCSDRNEMTNWGDVGFPITMQVASTCGEGPMLKAEEQMEIAVLKKHGESIRAIARAMGVSRNTVRRLQRRRCSL